jgi:hypothetical protein
VSFEPISQVLRLYESSSENCSSLGSICFLSSAEAIHRGCLPGGHLSSLSFEAPSKLPRTTLDLNLPSDFAGEELAIPDKFLVVHHGQESRLDLVSSFSPMHRNRGIFVHLSDRKLKTMRDEVNPEIWSTGTWLDNGGMLSRKQWRPLN